ncbi:MAG: alkaline phosphatase [Planctomycetota bacterium]
MRFGSKCGRICVLALSLVLITRPSAAAEVKNVILMIADGSGFNCWKAASMYQGKWDAANQKSTQVYDQPGWVAYGCSTDPLNMSKAPAKTNLQDPTLVYDPTLAWNHQGGYEWLKTHYTDSAAAATALSTARKTFNNAINWSDEDQPLGPTIAEVAKAKGWSVGVITTVQWSHATPAGLGSARTPERNNYSEIARQMVEDGVIDVIMGAGNPDFDNNAAPASGKARKKKAKGTKGKQAGADETCKYVGGAEAWKAIEEARQQPGGLYHGFRPVSTKAEFEALVSGPTPAKVLGTAQVGETLQQARAGKDTSDPATDTPLNQNVPDLAIMSQGALNVLDNNPKGLFLMIEGGAIDWANHQNQGGRMVQEQIDFVRAVEAVVEWVNANSNWDETLVILTADHETGLLLGPDSDTEPFAPIVDHGPGQMPGLKYHSKNHSNSLVPLYARGAASERLAELVVGRDPVYGPYVDNTGVAMVILEALDPSTTPAPSAQQRGRMDTNPHDLPKQ